MNLYTLGNLTYNLPAIKKVLMEKGWMWGDKKMRIQNIADELGMSRIRVSHFLNGQLKPSAYRYLLEFAITSIPKRVPTARFRHIVRK